MARARATKRETAPQPFSADKKWRICTFIKNRMRERGLTMRSVGTALQPSMSPQGLSNLLSGKPPLCITTLSQLADIVGVNVLTILSSVEAAESHFKDILSDDQQQYLLEDPFRYKVALAYGIARSMDEVKELFPSRQDDVKKVTEELLEKKIIRSLTNNRYRTSTESGIFGLSSHPKYNKLVMNLAGEAYENAFDILNNYHHLRDLQKTSFTADFLTKDQVRDLRQRIADLTLIARDYVVKNRTNPALEKAAKNNLYVFFTSLAPLTPSALLKDQI